MKQPKYLQSDCPKCGMQMNEEAVYVMGDFLEDEHWSHMCSQCDYKCFIEIEGEDEKY